MTKNNLPLVSVILTTYNRSNYLKRATESVLAQTYDMWELIIVDDGSVDDTEVIARDYCDSDKRISYIKQQNQGLPVARNNGLSHAKGFYVAFLDDDDQWVPEKLSIQIEFMQKNPEIGMSYTQFRLIGGRKDRPGVFPLSLPTTFLEFLQDNYILPSTIMFDKKCLDEVGWFNSRYKRCQDYDVFLRFVQKHTIAPIPLPLTVLIKDGRVHQTTDKPKTRLSAIDVLKNLKLEPGFQKFYWLKRRHIAKIHYDLGRDYVDLTKYWLAVKHFSIAILLDPFVGLMVKRPEEKGVLLIGRVMKAYAAIPWCVCKGLFNAKSKRSNSNI